LERKVYRFGVPYVDGFGVLCEGSRQWAVGRKWGRWYFEIEDVKGMHSKYL
jgi:hypothetical protein